MANPAVCINSEELLSAFSKRLAYYRKDRQSFDGSPQEPESSTKRKRELASDSDDEERRDVY